MDTLRSRRCEDDAHFLAVWQGWPKVFAFVSKSVDHAWLALLVWGHQYFFGVGAVLRAGSTGGTQRAPLCARGDWRAHGNTLEVSIT